VDVRTISTVDDKLLEHLRGMDLPVDKWLEYGQELTNLGLFRQYIIHYLLNQSIINTKATLMTRQLQPAENGLPVEVYAFYNSPDWAAFEEFQAVFIEHLYATLPEFGLGPFQRITNIEPELTEGV